MVFNKMKTGIAKKVAAVTLTAVISATLFSGLPLKVSAFEADPVVKIGLFYNTSALPSANLQNFTGSGYRIGFFNSSRVFTTLYNIADTKLTVLKDKHYNTSSGVFYDTVSTTTNILGAYHLQSPFTYSAVADVTAEVARLKAAGINAFPAYISGKYTVRIGSYISLAAANAAVSSYTAVLNGAPVAVGFSSTCYTVINTDTKAILFEFDYASNYLAIMPVSSGAKAQTWFKGYKYYGSFEYRRVNANDLTVINVLSLNDYVKGVIPYEISPKWNVETQKALAICARTFAVNNRNKHSAYGFDVCNTIDCQVYHGTNGATTLSDSAVDAVSNLYVSYGGKLCSTVYHSSNGGYTEDAVNVWSSNIAYLKAVPDNFEELTTGNNGIWQKYFTTAQIKTILTNKGYSIGTINSVYVEKLTAAGNVYRLTFKDTAGKTLNFDRERARTILGVNSQRYKVLTGDGLPTSTPLSTGTGNIVTVDGTVIAYANNSYNQLDNSLQNSYAIGTGGIVTQIGSSSVSVLTGVGSSSGIINQQPVVVDKYDTFCFDGRGWGHNVGLSQYGAKGMGDRGYKYDQILKYYYTGVTVGP